MNKRDLPPEIGKAYNDWANKEWERCMQLRASFENHVITYLMTANGGGAATVIAFAGAAGVANSNVYWSLSLFIAGLILCGIGIAIALTRMGWLSRELSADQRKFNEFKLGSFAMTGGHERRFKKNFGGTPVGYLSFGCFVAGVLLSAYTFSCYVEEKQLKQDRDAVATKGVEAALVEISKALRETHSTSQVSEPRGKK